MVYGYSTWLLEIDREQQPYERIFQVKTDHSFWLAKQIVVALYRTQTDGIERIASPEHRHPDAQSLSPRIRHI